MKREDCWMTFTDALELYLDSRECDAPPGCDRWECAQSDMRLAKEHLNALTGSES